METQITSEKHTEADKSIDEQSPVVLDVPVVRGKTSIDEVSVRKPNSGELRGIRLVDLANLDVNALVTILPRITVPSLTKHEVENMDPADLTELASKVALFLLNKKARMDIQ